jgi:hypothetical protein
MEWRRLARSVWRSSLNISGCVTTLVLATFLLLAAGSFLELLAGIGPVIVETIGRRRLSRMGNDAAVYAPYAASVFGACAILYLVRRMNRRDDPEYAPLPPDDDESDAN